MSVSYAPRRLTVPEGLDQLLWDFSKEVLRQQPADVYRFGAQYFQNLASTGTAAAPPPTEASLQDLPTAPAVLDAEIAAHPEVQQVAEEATPAVAEVPAEITAEDITEPQSVSSAESATQPAVEEPAEPIVEESAAEPVVEEPADTVDAEARADEYIEVTDVVAVADQAAATPADDPATPAEMAATVEEPASQEAAPEEPTEADEATAADATEEVGAPASASEGTAVAEPAAAPMVPSNPTISTGTLVELEGEFAGVVGDASALKTMWRSLDYNGNGVVSVSELTKWAMESYPSLNVKPAIIRAFKKTTLRDGDGDEWIQRAELPHLLVNMLYFTRAFVAYDKIDSGHDGRIDLDEFKAGLEAVGMQLDDAQAEETFGSIDSNEGGQILFDEFCMWLARTRCPVDSQVVDTYTQASKDLGQSAAADEAASAPPAAHDADADITSTKFTAVEGEIKEILASTAALRAAWNRIDYNGNGKVSLSETTKYLEETYPVLDHKPAIMRAYKKTLLVDGDGDSWLEKKEFPSFLRNILYFNRVFEAFDKMDIGDDTRIDATEFAAGLKFVGLSLTQEEAEEKFKEIDTNGGGQVLFDEFCAWLAKEQCPVNDEVMTGYTEASTNMGKSEEEEAKPIEKDYDADVTSATFDGAEGKIKEILKTTDALKAAWSNCDYNGNGKVSLSEVTKYLEESFPELSNAHATMRAFKKTTLVDGDGDSWLEKKEFPSFLRNILYMNRAWEAFQAIDSGRDGRIGLEEFQAGLKFVGLAMSADEAAEKFADIDGNAGGQILFDEFCRFLADEQCPVNGEVVEGYTMASTDMGTD